MIPNAWLDKIKDKRAFMEAVDPDWQSHFHDIDLALDFYTVMSPEEFERVLRDSDAGGQE